MDGLEAQPPTEQTINAPSPQDTVNSKTPTPPANSPISPNVPPSPFQKRHTHTCRPDQTPWWKTLLEGLALATVICYTIAAYKQLDTMNRTYLEMQKQTNLEQQQIAGTFGAIVPAEFPRPSPISDDPVLLKFQGINLFFANSGKVKATGFIADGTLRRVTLPDYKTLGIPQHKQVTAIQIRPYDQMPPGVPGVYAEQPDLRFDAADFTSHDIKRLHDYKEAIEVSGYTEYSDGFGNTVHQPFCFLYTVPLRHVFDNGAATGGGEGMWGLCEDVRRIVTQSLNWKESPK